MVTVPRLCARLSNHPNLPLLQLFRAVLSPTLVVRPSLPLRIYRHFRPIYDRFSCFKDASL